MMWRPDGWTNPAGEPWTWAYPDEGRTAARYFELGADAMLEALKKRGMAYPGQKDGEWGHVVWIPLEESHD